MGVVDGEPCQHRYRKDSVGLYCTSGFSFERSAPGGRLRDRAGARTGEDRNAEHCGDDEVGCKQKISRIAGKGA